MTSLSNTDLTIVAAQRAEPSTPQSRKTKTFDYSTCTAVEQALLKENAQNISTSYGKMHVNAVSIGNSLIEVRHLLGHGRFEKWLKLEFGWTDRTARSYMTAAGYVATFREDKTEVISVLPITLLTALASADTPESIKKTFIAKIEAGETINPGEFTKLIKALKVKPKKTVEADVDEVVPTVVAAPAAAIPPFLIRDPIDAKPVGNIPSSNGPTPAEWASSVLKILQAGFEEASMLEFTDLISNVVYFNTLRLEARKLGGDLRRSRPNAKQAA
jgi:hypothetical protein